MCVCVRPSACVKITGSREETNFVVLSGSARHDSNPHPVSEKTPVFYPERRIVKYLQHTVDTVVRVHTDP